MEGRWESILFPSKASLLLAFVQTIILEYLCQIPFLPFYCLPVYGWHNLVSQGIIRLNSDSRTVSDVPLMQHNYPSRKAEGIFVECVFPFLCITPAGKTSLLLQYFNEVKATWSKFPSCSCGQLVTHNCIRHSVLNGQFDDRCLLSLRSFETGQWSLGPKRCNFSKRFVVFKTSSGWMYMFLVTYSCVQMCFFAIALFSLWKLLPFMKLLRIFLYLLSFLGN